MLSSKTCFDLKYDGSRVCFYDKDGQLIFETKINVYTVSSKFPIGKNPILIQKDKYIIHDPDTVLNEFRPEMSYAWYAKQSALKNYNFSMNTKWDPCYTTDGSPNLESRHNIIVVPNFQILFKVKSNLLVFPLLETIIYIFPKFYGFDLSQIKNEIQGKYDESNKNEIKTMQFLFDYFQTEFNKFSVVEGCSLSDLHKCLFNSVLDHPFNELRDKISTTNLITRSMDRVYMVVKSSLIAKNACGDIEWYITAPNEKVIKKIEYYNGPFAFIPEKKYDTTGENDIYYHKIVVFNELKYNGKLYQHGNSIGLRDVKNPIIEFRGPIFHNISLYERVVLHAMFYEFVNRSLSEKHDFVLGMRNIPFPSMDCDKEFIDNVKTILVKILTM